MRAQSWNTGWTFTDRPLYPGAAGRDVTLPHDAAIASDVRPDAPAGRASGYYPGGMAIYTRRFDAPASWQGQRVMVAFDGVYGTTDVCLNGHWLACHHYGYTPFAVDLTPYLYFHRPNRLEVTANNTAQPNSRWYTGTGIYRPVSLLVGPPVHIAPWGIFAHTDTLENDCARVTGGHRGQPERPGHGSARNRHAGGRRGPPAGRGLCHAAHSRRGAGHGTGAAVGARCTPLGRGQSPPVHCPRRLRRR